MNNSKPFNHRVNSILVLLRFMDADRLARWVSDRAGNYTHDEAQALEIHLAELQPWQIRRAG